MKTIIKNLFISLLVLVWVSTAITSASAPLQATTKPYYKVDNWSEASKLDTDFWEIIKDKAVWSEDSKSPTASVLVRILDIFNLSADANAWRYKGPLKALYYAQYLINYALAFVSVIALCLLIYSFYAVIVWDEKQIDKAKAYLKWIAIAIIVISLAWVIVSMIFWIYEEIAQRNSYKWRHPNEAYNFVLDDFNIS